MESEYTHRVTVCTPIYTMYHANQLACIVGESEDDINTFTEATHEREGELYACIHTPVKDVFLGAMVTPELPEHPHAANADRAAAYKAREWSLDGTIVVDFIPNLSAETGTQVLARLGFTPIHKEDE